MSGCLLGIYRPPLASPGIPGIDFPIGRTSTNQLMVGMRDATGTTSTSVTVAGGLVGTDITLTTQAGITTWSLNQLLTVKSGSNANIYFYGTVKSYSGTTLVITCNVVGTSGTKTDWSIYNLPYQCGYDGSAGVFGFRTGSTVADFSIIDWDFRGIDACWYLQGTKNIAFSQCLFDLSNYSVQNSSYMARRSQTPTFTIQNCTFNGNNFSTQIVTNCFAGALSLCEYNDIQSWPLDWADIGPTTGQPTNIRYNRVIIASSTAAIFGQHADVMQLGSSGHPAWNTGSGLNIYNNVLTLNPTPPGGSGVSFPLNFATGAGDWTVPVSVHDNIFYGGSRNFQIQQTPNVMTSTISFVNNYVDGAISGIFYPDGTTMANITVDSFKSSIDGSIQTFTYTDSTGIKHNNVTSIP